MSLPTPPTHQPTNLRFSISCSSFRMRTKFPRRDRERNRKWPEEDTTSLEQTEAQKKGDGEWWERKRAEGRNLEKYSLSGTCLSHQVNKGWPPSRARFMSVPMYCPSAKLSPRKVRLNLWMSWLVLFVVRRQEYSCTLALPWKLYDKQYLIG